MVGVHHPHGPPELHAGEVADVGKRGDLRRREAQTRRRQPRDVTMRNFPLSLAESGNVIEVGVFLLQNLCQIGRL